MVGREVDTTDAAATPLKNMARVVGHWRDGLLPDGHRITVSRWRSVNDQSGRGPAALWRSLPVVRQPAYAGKYRICPSLMKSRRTPRSRQYEASSLFHISDAWQLTGGAVLKRTNA